MLEWVNWVSVIALTVHLGCKPTPQIVSPPAKFTEQYRPQFHFTPPSQWMNDPNGMFYYEGEYHLFYQHYPDSNVSGPMHWGHAISEDLIRWEHLPIALNPDSLGYIYSGSTVVDWGNTSGFGTTDIPPIVAIYTYHNPFGEKSGSAVFQYQGIAYSRDKGRTWTKYEGNPVLNNPGIRDFRDPKVTWFEPDQKWIMTLAVYDHVSFYSSEDLKSWKWESDFGADWGSHAGVWECPDLIQLPVEGTNEKKWVLIVSINPGGPQEGSATQYFVGEFDGNKFALDQHFQTELVSSPGNDLKVSENFDRFPAPSVENAIWIDYGADNYAGVTWSDVVDGRTIFIGWMNNWQYANRVPTKVWRGAMTLPRVLTLHLLADSYRVFSFPAEELNSIIGPGSEIDSEIPDSIYLLELQVSDDFMVSLLNDRGENVVISLSGDIFLFDRTNSGNVDFSIGFGAVHSMNTIGVEVRNVRLYVDTSSIEVFINNGALVMTELVFPSEYYNRIVYTGGILNVTLFPIKSIWQPE